MQLENGWFGKKGSNTRSRLLIFPHAGSTAISYRRILEALPNPIEGWVYEYPGHGLRSNEPLVSSVAGLVTQCAPPKNGQEKCTVVLGHSMGAHVGKAWVAQTSFPAQALIVSASPSPTTLALQAATGGLPSSDLAISQHIQTLGGMNSTLLESAEFMQYLLPILRNDYQVLASSCSLSVKKLAARIYGVFGESDNLDPTATDSWRLETLSTYEERRVGGGHFYWVSSPGSLIQTIHEAFNDAISA